MGVGELYLLFMVSVGLWSCYELMRPTMIYLDSMGKHDDILYQNKVVSYTTQFCIAAVFAPIFVIIILVPSLNRAVVLAMAERDE